VKIEIVGEDSKVVELKLVLRAGQPAVAAGAGASLGTPRPAAAATAPVPVPASAPVRSRPRPRSNLPRARASPAQGEVTESTESSKWSGLRFAGIVAAGVGVVGLVTGGILWAAATSKNDDAVSQWQTDQSQARSTRSDAEGLATGANVCLIAGGVLAGVGVVTTLLTFGNDSPSKTVALAPALGPNFAGLTMKGIW
jgi:hypothetical protein